MDFLRPPQDGLREVVCVSCTGATVAGAGESIK
uniref:Uncharacterized protein n=1 Tax=Myoviridae sp. ct2Qy24 TaxID=2827656 RepID=A0A8S5SSB9_9CAUD|nr:MAG TPA: hypothetical protein [Myoviridae sp. ct2Qy24]